MLVLGIRPDVIRASLLIKQLKHALGDAFVFVWSGQHYSANLRDVFFSQLEVPQPDHQVNVDISSETRFIASLTEGLSELVVREKPAFCGFLGDTNTVLGSLACAAHNVPIFHIEGCMRSYDWRMPEEKYRTVIDHLSDVIYAYLPAYKRQGEAEGLDARSIVVTGNPIVDVLQYYFTSGRIRMSSEDFSAMMRAHHLDATSFVLMTAHRRENVDNRASLDVILELVRTCPFPVVFPASYRTQRSLREFGLARPHNLLLIDPIGYIEFLELLSAARYVMTDSGTVVEEAAILGVPSIQMRSSTERPEVYECGASVKFDPHAPSAVQMTRQSHESAIKLRDTDWHHGLGDGTASETILNDMLSRLRGKLPIRGHDPRGSTKPYQRNWM